MYHKSMLLLCFLLAYSFTQAQYFGRNKVQYHVFDFKVLETENMDVHFYPSQQDAATDAARMLERWNTRLEKIFSRGLPDNQPVILYSTHAHFQQTNTIGGMLDQTTGGVTEGLMNRVILPLTGVNSDNDHVLGHELVHAFQFELMRANEAGLGRMGELPLWFIEGMAEYLSLGSLSPHTAMWMRDAVLRDDVPDFEAIGTHRRYFPYRFGHAIIAYIGGVWGDRAVGTLYNNVLTHGWYGGYRRALGSPIDSVSNRWRQSAVNHFEPTLQGRVSPLDVGETVINDNAINLSPVISPNGSKFVFMSTKDIFSIDLYIADAKSGAVDRRLVSSQTDDHFDALRFINSSGTWSPDGEKLAFVVFREGRNDLAFIDVNSATIETIVSIEEVEEITGLAWSPDGKYMALSGTMGAVSNLYLYEIETDSIWKITDDKFAQIQPAWGPNGDVIAYATDQGPHSDLESLSFGKKQIALFNIRTGNTEVVSIAPWAKHINPQFSKDGKSLFMIADPDGVSDIYRYSFENGEFYRVTNIATGISGLTDLAPAMSLSWETEEMLLSVFTEGVYKIQRLNSDELEGEIFKENREDYTRVVSLPPQLRSDSTVDNYLVEPSEGLVDASEFTVRNYTPRLRLHHVGQLAVGVAANRYGMGVGGGASFIFSDMLGDHMLGLGLQINGNINDIAAEGLYLYQRRRTNFGLNLSRIPYRSSWIRGERGSEGEETVEVYELIQQRLYENRARLFLEYPFSINRRLEFTGGLTRYSYDYSAEEYVFRDGILDDQREAQLDEPRSLNLIQNSLGFVGDFSFTGFTGPLAGRRYRYELEHTTGTLNFLTAIADYRQYFFLNPFTVAYRFLHYGRYLGDSESQRLSPLFVGLETWVRGYSSFTYDLRGCGVDNDYSECPEFDRLIGSRVGVFNLELRLPLIGTEQFGIINFPYLPVELAGFLDGGVAWTADQRPDLRWETENINNRVPVFSTGAAARINILGLLILQVYYAHPFQRPDYGRHWGFVFAPGW
ncbi:hypothetical protein QA601_09315 [Chitinispirillales bacterium ANBcel5]|uniref:peptidase S9 n=1 Tax=Cellulosispirillum alkaliphilum TaxID=3039283 RepID=UPI002A53B34A|nr:hypothetical protein [Chitinispirillales bacterium ANBcel5]